MKRRTGDSDSDSEGDVEDLEEVGLAILSQALTRLTELAIFSDGDRLVTGIVPVLTPVALRGLVSLHLHGAPCSVSELLEAPLQGLRVLSVDLGEATPAQCQALCSARTGLDSLSLEWRDPSAQDVVRYLPQLTRLSALRLGAPSENSEFRVPATFLTGLTGLQQLTLCHVLSKYNAEADIQCVAALTRLTWLVVRSPNRNYFEEVEPAPPPQLKRCSFLPLGALRLLEAWDLNTAWDTIHGPNFGLGLDRENDPDIVVKDLLCCVGYSWRHYSRRTHFSIMGSHYPRHDKLYYPADALIEGPDRTVLGSM